MTTKKILKSEEGSVWIQPNGANSQTYYLGTCVELDAITEPLGTRDLLSHLTPDGKYEAIGEKTNPPDKVTGTIMLQSERSRSWLEKMLPKCNNANLYVNQTGCKRKDVFNSWEVNYTIRNFKLESRSRDGMVKLANNSQFSKVDHTYSGWYPIINNVEVSINRKANTEANAGNDIVLNKEQDCWDCGTPLLPGTVGAIACDAGAAASANVLFLSNGVWTAGASDPFAINQHIVGITYVMLPNNTRRYIAAMNAPAGAQGMVAYTDDTGANWTTVNIGGAAAGHGGVYGGCLFALDYSHIWLASAQGYIYFSNDGGVTWTAQESGAIHSGNYMQVKFTDELYGVAVGANGIVAVTRNGGENWYAATVVGGGASTINTVDIIDRNHLWVGLANGTLYYSNDFGTTWTQRTGFTGSGAGQIRDIKFMSGLKGYMLKNSAAPVCTILETIDGGYTWRDRTTPTNSGCNKIEMIDYNEAMFVGEVNGGTIFIGDLGE